ncbi:MAG TPA: methyltransferase [Polyangiaceae bacterium]
MSAHSDPTDPGATAGDERVECEHADRCGGCPIIGLSYGEQLSLKRGRVVQSVSRYSTLELVYTEPVVPAQPVVGYRTRAKLIVAEGGKLGLFAKGGGHQVVDIPRCRVLAPVLGRVASVIRARIARDEEEGGPLAPHKADGRGSLRAIDLREVREGDVSRVLVTFVVQRGREGAIERAQEAARDIMRDAPDVVGVAINFHEGDAPQILGSQTHHLAGATSAPDRVGSSVHLATFGSFVQAHRGQTGRVHALLAEIVGQARARAPERKVRVLDLYGGSGAIALGLAANGAEVRLVESFAPAVAQARAAAEAHRLAVDAECADAAAALRRMVEARDRFDAVVVNPPAGARAP